MLRVCAITGSRAEYGLLYWVLRDLRDEKDVELQLVVTGMHLSAEHGHTADEIEKDGFRIDRRVPTLLAGDSAQGVAKAIGAGVAGVSEALASLSPDVVLVLGDRFEIFAAVQACLVHRVPVAHIGGGDTSEGAFDESLRHAITKLAHVHFVTNEVSARRVRQLGEDPRRVHVVGSPGLDHLRRSKLLDRAGLEAALGERLGSRNLLVTFHPVTLEPDEGAAEFRELLAALEATGDARLWFTRPNADTGSRGITATLDGWVAKHAHRARVYTSLGQVRYLSLMAQVDAVVGNSSSGLYEAPSLGVPTVDVGERQRGRLAAASVLHCAAERGAIEAAVQRAMDMDCNGVLNPYGDGQASGRIVAALRALPPAAELLKKRFYFVDG